ncbi:pyridoxamine 5'-phosphate oxidase [Nocardioidaceae bacterium]|nr:pyridoxamine 5'-phosphate oxidase [Nocardioidaceae bacterium]
MPDYEDLRVSYSRDELDETSAPAAPWELFDRWFDAAQGAGLPEPNAMTLATVDGRGRPHVRTVLLKGMEQVGPSDRAPVFYSNRRSDKGSQLAGNPACALLFTWLQLERQVRLEGTVTELSEERSDAYFASRPRGSQLGAWASPQSQVVMGREDLERRYAAVEQRYAGQPVPRPAYWGGWRVDVACIEFWQGRGSRMHDRLRYRHEADGWHRERLGP